MSDSPSVHPEGPRETHEAAGSGVDAAPEGVDPIETPQVGSESDSQPQSQSEAEADSRALEELDPVALRRWAFRARAALARHRGGIDALNVFPVPDGDTGTNMLATLTGAIRGALPGGGSSATARSQSKEAPHGLDAASDVQGSTPHRSEVEAHTVDAGEVDAAEVDAGEVDAGEVDAGEHETSRLEAVARTSVTSARGNSGAILGELLRGLAQVAGAGRARIDGPTLAAALRTASERAWQAVGRPVDGTMLSVARGAAAAADRAARRGGRLVDVTGAAVEGARTALASTPEQLPTLKRAGVVDAGGAGLLVVLTALHDVVTRGRTGDDLPPGLGAAPPVTAGAAAATAESPDLLHGGGSGDSATPPAEPAVEVMVEVMYVVTGADAQARARLRDGLDALGDSVVVAGDADGASVHVHTTQVEAAVACGRVAGEVSELRIESLVPALSAATTQDPPGLPPLLCHWLSTDLTVPLPGVPFGEYRDEAQRARGTRELILVTDRPDDLDQGVDSVAVAGASTTKPAPSALPMHVIRCESLPAVLAALSVYDMADDAPHDAAATEGTGTDPTAGIERTIGIERTVRSMRAAAADVTAIVVPRGVADDDGGDDPRGRAGIVVAGVESAIEAGGELVTIIAGIDGVAAADALEVALRGRDVEIARFATVAPMPEGLVVVGVE